MPAQRTSFDVNSIAALLRQTEVNLATLGKPRPELPRYAAEEPRPSWPSEPQAIPCAAAMAQAPTPVRASSGLGSGLELESQVLQLRSCLETLERRLEDELRSFLAVSDKRLQAREEQLRGIGDTLQASADAALEQLNRRVDSRLRELERGSHSQGQFALEEVWESLKRSQADCLDLDSKVKKAVSAEELNERMKEVDRHQQQRLEERLTNQERRLSEYRAQLQSSSEVQMEAISRRCEALEKQVWETHSDKTDIIEVVLKRIGEAAPIRELQEEIRAVNYEKEVQKTRVVAAEAKLSKLSALESKVDYLESQTTQQLEDQAQQFKGLGDLQQKLLQKITISETSLHRVETQTSSLQARVQNLMDEERERSTGSLDSLQVRIMQQVGEAESRVARSASRVKEDVMQHLSELIKDSAEASAKALEAEVHRQDRLVQDLKASADSSSKALDAELYRQDRFLQELASKQALQEQQVSRLAGTDVHRSQLESIEMRLSEMQGDQRLAREVKSSTDVHRSQLETIEMRLSEMQGDHRLAREVKSSTESLRAQAERRYADFDSTILSLEARMEELQRSMETHRSNRDSQRGAEFLEQRNRFEGLEQRLSELQVTTTRNQSSLDSLKATVTGLEPLRASITTLEGTMAVTEEQLARKSQEWSATAQQTRSWHEAESARLNELTSNLQRQQTGLDSIKTSTVGIESRGENLRVAMSSLEAVVQSIQERLAQGVEPEGSSSARYSQLDVQELISAAEGRTVQRANRECEALRTQLLEVRSLCNSMSDARTSSNTELEVKLQTIQDSVAFVKSELGNARTESQEFLSREARLGAELSGITSSVGALQSELRETTSKAVGQVADIAQLQQQVLTLQSQQRAASFLNTNSSLDASGMGVEQPSSPAGTTRQSAGVQDPKGSVSTPASNIRLTRVEERLRRLEDQADQLPPGLSERMRLLEEASDSASTRSASAASAASSALTAATSALDLKIDDLGARLASLETDLRRQQQAGAMVHQPPQEARSEGRSRPRSPDSDIEARLSRLEDQLLSLDSLDASVLDTSVLPTGAGTQGPPQSTVMLTLSWADGASGSVDPSNQESIRSALQGAVPAAGLELLKVDASAAAVSGTPVSPGGGRGTVCWLTAADASGAEAELRRQLQDPGSMLRRMLPGLVAEDSSATALQAPMTSAVIAQTRNLALRVNSLERSQEQLADGLSSVERQVLNVEGRLAGTLGVPSVPSLAYDGPKALGNLSDSDMQDSGIGIHQPGLAGRAQPRIGMGRGAASALVDDSMDSGGEDGSIRDLDFGASSFDAASPPRPNVQSLQRGRADEAREAERRRAEEEAARKRRQEAEEELNRAQEAERQRKQAEEEAEVQRRAEEDARRRREAEQELQAAQEAERRRKLAEEEAEARRKEEEAERQRKLAEEEAEARCKEEEAERQRKLAEEEAEARCKEEEAERQRKLAEEEAEARRKEEAEKQRKLAQEAEARRKEEEAERQRKLAEEEAEARCKEEEAERQRKLAEEEAEARRKEEAEKQRKLAQEAEARRKEEEDAERQRKQAAEAEAQRKAEEEAQQRQEAERQRKLAEEQAEAHRKAEQEEAQKRREAEAELQRSKGTNERSRRARVTGLPLTARASARSKDEEIRKAFNDIDTSSSGVLSLDDLQSYLCDHLGFGRAEAIAFHERCAGSGGGDLTFEQFKTGYATLNPFVLTKRQSSVFIRKSGSISSHSLQVVQLEELDDCEVYICDKTSQAFIDVCKRSVVLVGPCETSVFVRDCEDCVFWIAAQQLRTRDCKNCTFFLYSKTEPCIESSEELAFAPWCASYPFCSAHFNELKFDPARNLWNAIFDFTGQPDRSNWRILQLDEVRELEVDLDDVPPKASPENPVQRVSHELLCMAPLESGESAGQSISNIPQTRPALPAAPPAGFKEVKRMSLQDAESNKSRTESLLAPFSRHADSAERSEVEVVTAPPVAVTGTMDASDEVSEEEAAVAPPVAVTGAMDASDDVSEEEAAVAPPVAVTGTMDASDEVSEEEAAVAPPVAVTGAMDASDDVSEEEAAVAPPVAVTGAMDASDEVSEEETPTMLDSSKAESSTVQQPPAQCPKCGNVYLEDAVFCRKCGSKREAAAPTVQGGMAADTDEESSDGDAARPAAAASSAPLASAISQPVAPVGASAAVSEQEMKRKKDMVASMLGESDSEEDEPDQPAKPSPSSASSALGSLASLTGQAKSKAAPKAGSGSMPWQRTGLSQDEDEDSEDIEEVMKKATAASAAMRSSPSRGSSTASLPRSSGLQVASAVASGSKPQGGLSVDVGDDVKDGSNSWDGSSMGSPSPTARKALGIDSPASSAAASPAKKAASPAGAAAPSTAQHSPGQKPMSPGAASSDNDYSGEFGDEDIDLPM
eukprot:TRINITY_DN517_c0_g1_i6.p1 TRINITY_DN517_c0_g1~~TRINITY_DN517_c0_g1_i6.p1  ORF type:complete len:2392 (-),score=709.48 TRINITY_DN517_c0_g1_i6:39-7214(-)